MTTHTRTIFVSNTKRARIRDWVGGSRFWRLSKGTKITLLIGLVTILAVFLMAIFAEFVSPYDPYEMSADSRLEPPGASHLLGTDNLGRDVFSRCVYGTRISLFIGFLAAALSASVGSTLGVTIGYFGGLPDRVMTLFMDALWALPGFIIALLVVVSLGPNIENTALAVGIGWIPSYYRSVRSLVIALREEEFIEAEISIGASDLYIIFRHVFPLCFSVIIVIMTMGIAHSIIVAAGLGFLGLGIPPPLPELGADIAQGRQVLPQGIWWTTISPSLFVFIMIIGFNLFGEGLNRLLGARLEEI